MKKNIAIVDYGLGNIHSLVKAFGLFGTDIKVTGDAQAISASDAIVLPGVGAFSAGMDGLRSRDLIDALRRYAASGKPMLGICLGAQLLLDRGFEFGEHEGLGIIPGNAVEFPASVTKVAKVPHIGWNEIYPRTPSDWEGTIFAGVTRGSPDVYFVHSYIMVPEDAATAVAFSEYGGTRFTAALRKGNVYGVQFHPEKSGETGLEILKNFTRII